MSSAARQICSCCSTSGSSRAAGRKRSMATSSRRMRCGTCSPTQVSTSPSSTPARSRSRRSRLPRLPAARGRRCPRLRAACRTRLTPSRLRTRRGARSRRRRASIPSIQSRSRVPICAGNPRSAAMSSRSGGRRSTAAGLPRPDSFCRRCRRCSVAGRLRIRTALAPRPKPTRAMAPASICEVSGRGRHSC